MKIIQIAGLGLGDGDGVLFGLDQQGNLYRLEYGKWEYACSSPEGGWDGSAEEDD